MDAIGFSVGDFRLSALALVKGIFWLFALLYLAIFTSGFIERRIFQIKSLTRSSQVLAAKITRVTLIVIAVLIGITSAGIDLSLFAVFGGAIGLGIGQNLLSMAAQSINVEDFAQAIKDVLDRKETAISHNEAREIVNKYFEELETKLNAENIEKGKSFLEENAKRPGVVTLPSGLQYEVITEGNGKKPSATDRVKCHYEGTLIDGTLFDSSIKRGEPAIFGVNQVIKGWVEALQLMTEGAKWKLFIPSELAYGAQQAGEMIPPHSTLIFEVELIEVL